MKADKKKTNKLGESKYVLIRLPKETHKKLKYHCISKSISIQKVMVDCISKLIEGDRVAF